MILALLRKPMTWRLVIAASSAAGVSLRPDLWEAITSVGIAVAGLLEVAFRHGKNSTPVLPAVATDPAGRTDPPAGATRLPVADRADVNDQPVFNADELRENDLLSHGRPESGPVDRDPPAGWNG